MEQRYGDENTWHRTGTVDVELAPDGTVCAVWFRCRLLPFTQTRVEQSRADEMHRAHAEAPAPLMAVVFAEEGS